MKFKAGIITKGFGLALLVLLVIAMALISPDPTSAQEQGDWPHPYQLSTSGRKSSEGFPVSDGYGNAHVFWSEALPNDAGSVIRYAKYDGKTWTVPIDLYITPPSIPIVNLSPYVDSKQTLHLIWTQGFSGATQLYYMHAPANTADQLQNWSERVRGKIRANDVRLIVDDVGILHLLYTKVVDPEAGVFYASSADSGVTWSDSKWLDPDIPPNNIPNYLQFKSDGKGGFHASWFYSTTDTAGGNWVRYAHSLDNGTTWSLPMTIAKVPPDDEVNTLAAASPVLAVEGDMVHIVWAGGEFHYRNHRYSEDRGETWSDPVRIFGSLQGQAFESLTTDGAGRINYFGQIRYPVAIYHAFWENGHWSPTELIYLISADASDPIGDRIHAHHVFATIRAGNQAVVTFADPPPTENRRLFVMVKDLEGVPPAAPLPTPIATPQAPPDATPTPIVEATPTVIPLDAFEPPSEQAGRPRGIIIAGLISPLLLLLGTFLLRGYFNRNRW